MSNNLSKQRIGVVSIAPTLPNPAELEFDRFYAAIGKNTGNYMFTTAMYRQLAGTVEQIGFGFDPDKVNASYDAVVIPCANWLSAAINWDWLIELLERVEIPVIPIGLGLQAEKADLSIVQLSASAERLVRVFSEKAKLISVRGDFTKAYLNSINVDNVVTTGCPSLYLRLGADQGCTPGGGVALQSTRYWITPNFAAAQTLNRKLFGYAVQVGADMIFQSEPEELRYLIHRDVETLKPADNPDMLARLYGLNTAAELARFLDAHGYFFTDLDSWSTYVRTKAAVVGTRLHGTIIALNSGVPSVLFAHDSRTAEMADYAKLPTFETATLDQLDLEKLPTEDAIGRYVETRERNGHGYRAFLRENNLDYNEAVLF